MLAPNVIPVPYVLELSSNVVWGILAFIKSQSQITPN